MKTIETILLILINSVIYFFYEVLRFNPHYSYKNGVNYMNML